VDGDGIPGALPLNFQAALYICGQMACLAQNPGCQKASVHDKIESMNTSASDFISWSHGLQGEVKQIDGELW